VAKKIENPQEEEESKYKKPARVLKPLTQRELELNTVWYSSPECAAARIKHWTDEHGNPFNNPFKNVE
jgi:hypothetical protein